MRDKHETREKKTKEADNSARYLTVCGVSNSVKTSRQGLTWGIFKLQGPKWNLVETRRAKTSNIWRTCCLSGILNYNVKICGRLLFLRLLSYTSCLCGCINGHFAMTAFPVFNSSCVSK